MEVILKKKKAELMSQKIRKRKPEYSSEGPKYGT